MKQGLIPVILAGGSGTRLWPLSKQSFPKQFLKLIENHSLFQETLLRVKKISYVQEIFVVINQSHRLICQDQIQELGLDNIKIILEPCSRNTAPAIALAAQTIDQRFGQEVLMVVLPSDHLIGGGVEFAKMIESVIQSNKEDGLITFGVTPTSAKTGYGYIRAGRAFDHLSYRVDKFMEKPNLALARKFFKKKNYYWNSGIFLFCVATYLKEVKRYAPAIYTFSLEAFQKSHQKQDCLYIDQESFKKCPNDSIDYAVMEKTDKGIVVPFDLPWNDLGCWASVADVKKKDDNDNIIRGNGILKDCEGCFLTAESQQLVAIIGVKNLIVISTPEAILIADKGHAQEVKQIAKSLDKALDKE